MGVGARAVQQLELLLGLGVERLELLGPLDDPVGDLRAGVVAGRRSGRSSALSSSAIRRNAARWVASSPSSCVGMVSGRR